MPDVVTSSKAIHAELEAIVRRNNEKILALNSLPDVIRSQMDNQIFDDIEYLLRYITALQGVLKDVASKPEERKHFEF